jgi:hypothetical protein
MAGFVSVIPPATEAEYFQTKVLTHIWRDLPVETEQELGLFGI